MSNPRSLLLAILALGVTSSLFACTGSKSSKNLPSTRPTVTAQSNIAQSNIKVRHSTVRLDFREQKPRTEAQLQAELQVQQELLKQQIKLKKSGNQAVISTHEVALKQNGAEIASLFEKPILTEKNLTEAYADPIANSNTSSVGLKFDANGTKIFTTLTKKLAGTGRALGVFLNDRLISSPMIASEFARTGITSGSAVITRNFSAQEANDLAAQLRGDSPAILPK